MADQIRGWKSIGGYFGRDRTTAMRWARDRGLPVRRMPGGQRATVYALKSELDAWLIGQGEDQDLVVLPPEEAAPLPGRSRRWMIAAAAVPVVAVGVGVVLWRGQESRGSEPSLPADPILAQTYMSGRDDWARRTPESLTRALASFQEVTRRAPDFGPGHASFAEALLLAREFGAMADAEAFPRARVAAETALELDGRMASAHRAIGFILYWWEHDAPAAGRAMRRALALSPRDAQSRFWYGNILADNGRHRAAMREFDAARLIEPGSTAIQTDLAWALWCAGRRDEALPRLSGLAESHPDFAVIHDCLAIIRFADGDLAGYAASLATYASLRGDSALAAHARTLMMAAGVDRAHALQMVLDKAIADAGASPRRHHAWAAFVASIAGTSGALDAVLTTAERRKEAWGDAGLVLRMTALAAGRPDILSRIQTLRAPAVER